MKEILSVQETAMKWNVPERTVRKWCIYNKINALQINNEWGIYSKQSCPILELNEFNLQGLDNAVQDFNNWQDVARIYLDLENRFVWTSLYLFEHEHDIYDFLIVREIYNKGLREDSLREITKEQLLTLCYEQYLLDQLTLELEIEPPELTMLDCEN